MFTTLVSFAYIAERLDLDLRHSGPRPRRDFGVTGPRLRKTCLETSRSLDALYESTKQE